MHLFRHVSGLARALVISNVGSFVGFVRVLVWSGGYVSTIPIPIYTVD